MEHIDIPVNKIVSGGFLSNKIKIRHWALLSVLCKKAETDCRRFCLDGEEKKYIKISYKELILENPVLKLNNHNIKRTLKTLEHFGFISTKKDIENIVYVFIEEKTKSIFNLSERLAETETEKIRATGYVYFAYFKNSNIVKIGSSKNPKKRIKELNKTSYHELCLFGVLKTDGEKLESEKRVHCLFKSFREKGEYFNIGKEKLRKFIIENEGEIL